ncbi:hypothetical protein ES319_D06G203800v1 [Gossypium barbadense]|uniref:ENTH domain-containing protein n=1 Tax=Gossypium barbadense TaxID=3634 RepID=A0A5J5R7H2_GOSBA|nr:hypothetical protein ES319_D06G203800v1 [Gossypium barbadense]
MGSVVFHEFKRQASFFLKEQIKTVRLALTDVTPVEFLTEEATDGNMLSPNACKLAEISRAAFEVDDYWRIVKILHKRLSKFDAKNWRASYNALVLLEHLLTHGPLRVAEEFQDDEHYIKQMANFQYIDEKRFNWGLRVRKLSEKILKLLENESFLKEERSRARQLTMGIKGFGSFNNISPSKDESFNWFSNNGRFGSTLYFDQNDEEHYFWEFKEKLTPWKLEETKGINMSLKRSKDGEYEIKMEHPFCEHEMEDVVESLLS